MLDNDREPVTYTVTPRSRAAVGLAAALIGMDYGREPGRVIPSPPKQSDPAKKRKRKAQRRARAVNRRNG